MNGGQVYAELERQIILGGLRPRERMVEAELTGKLGVSRTLLREVFRRLEGVGLIVLSPNRGAVVRDFSPKEIDDLYAVRSVLERAVAPLIVERTVASDLQELRALNRQFEAACRRRDMAAMIWTNITFHRRMSAVSGNAFLCQLLDVSRLQTNQIRYIVWTSRERVEESIRDHREMLAALARKEGQTFEAALFRHVAGGKGDYQRIFPVGASRDAQGGPGLKGRRPTRAASRRKEVAHA